MNMNSFPPARVTPCAPKRPDSFTLIGSYGYNYAGLGRDDDQSLGLSGQRETAVRQPSRMIAFGDCLFRTAQDVLGPPFGLLIRNAERPPDSGEEGAAVAAEWARLQQRLADWMNSRHDGKLNMVFCDDHVETFKWEKITLGKSEDILSQWNCDGLAHTNLLN